MSNYLDFKLPRLYSKFLSEIEKIQNFVIAETGITLYSRDDLKERNQT